MKTNCSACGAQNESTQSNCNYCGNTLTSSEEIQKRIDVLNENGSFFKLAETAFEGEDYDEALRYYNKCLEKDPDFFEAWYKKGLSTLKTSTVGNLKGQQSSSSFKIALNNAPDKESFKLRLKKDVLPFVKTYLYAALNHYQNFYSISGAGPEFAEKIARASDVIDFVSSVTTLNIGEVKELYNTLDDVYKKQKKVMQKVLLSKGGTDKINNDLAIADKLIRSTLNDKLLPMWQNLESSTAPDKKAGCFIATAAMGDYDHPVVMDLRRFRDNWLLQRNWGKDFTNWYYTHGPKAAKVIEKSTVLKRITYYVVVKPLQFLTKKLR